MDLGQCMTNSENNLIERTKHIQIIYATKAQPLGDASVYKLSNLYKRKIIKASKAYHMPSLYVGLKILMKLVNTEKIDYMLDNLIL